MLQGRARGNRLALQIRSRIQGALFRIGCISQRHCGKVVLLGFVVMCIFAIGLTRAKLETNAEKLWVEGKFQTLTQVGLVDVILYWSHGDVCLKQEQ